MKQIGHDILMYVNVRRKSIIMWKLYLGTTRKQIVIGRGYTMSRLPEVFIVIIKMLKLKKKKYALIRK